MALVRGVTAILSGPVYLNARYLLTDSLANFAGGNFLQRSFLCSDPTDTENRTRKNGWVSTFDDISSIFH